MSKFKIRLKIQGFELEVEGTREDIPTITQNIGQEFAGMLAPVAQIVEGENPNQTNMAPTNGSGTSENIRKKRVRKTISTREGTDVEAVDWVHDASKWGNPLQDWSTSEKSIWLLYVAKNEKGTGELSLGQITKTFNKHFKQAKLIIQGNVGRDLGKLKVKPDAWVGEDTTKTPTTWFLTQNGQKEAERLVSIAKGTK